MKRTQLFGAMMACTLAAAVAVGAQEPQPTTTSQTARDAKSVVVTGCLKSDPSAAGTAGATGTSGSTSSTRENFVLTDASVSGGSSSTATTDPTSPTTTSPTPTTTSPTPTTTSPATPTTTSPTGTSGSSTADTKTFSLVGGSPSDLQQYVNSKVEITGTIDPNANRSSAGASSTGITAGSTGATATGGGSTMASMVHNQQLRVTSVRQVASSCSGQ